MRRLVIMGIGLLVLLAGLLLLPGWAPRPDLRAWLAGQLTVATGYPVAIHGDVSFHLLPSPGFSAGQIGVDRLPATHAPETIVAQTNFVTAEALEVSVAPFPLLTGSLELTGITLIRPVLHVDVRPVSRSQPDAARGQRLALETIQIRDGRVLWFQNGVQQQLDHLDATLAFDEQGQSNLDWQAQSGGVKLGGMAAIGRWNCAGPSPVQAHLQGFDPAITADFQGAIAFPVLFGADCAGPATDRAPAALVQGRLALAAPHLTGLAGIAVLGQKIGLGGDLLMTAGTIELGNLSVDIDRSHGTGRFGLDFSAAPLAVDLVLNFDHVDLDDWLQRQAANATGAGALVQPLLAALRAVAPEISLHTDLSVDTLAWRDDLIRQARLALRWADHQLILDQATALLPGGTAGSLSGMMMAPALSGGVPPQFNGRVEIDSDNLRLLLVWLGFDPRFVPADRLHHAGLTADLVLDSDQALLGHAAFDLDGADFKIDAGLQDAGKLLALRVKGDRLNLDAYLPGDRSLTTLWPSGLPIRLNADLGFETLLWRGELWKAVHLAGSVDGALVTLDQGAITDIAGGQAQFSGRFKPGDPQPLVALDLSMQGPDASILLHWLRADHVGSGLPVGAYRLTGRAEAGEDGLHLRASGSVAGADVTLTGLYPPGQVAAFSGQLDLTAPEDAALLRSLWPGETGRGPLMLKAGLQLQPGRIMVPAFKLALGPQQISGQARWEDREKRPFLDLTIMAGDIALGPLLPDGVELADAEPFPPLPRWEQNPLALDWLSAIDAAMTLRCDSLNWGRYHFHDVAAAASLSDGRLSLTGIDAKFGDGSLALSGALDPNSAPMLRVTGTTHRIQIRDDWGGVIGPVIDGGLDLRFEVSANGRSPALLLRSLAGSGRLHLEGGTLDGINLLAVDRHLTDLAQAPDFIAGFSHLANAGTTKLISLDVDFTLADGVLLSSAGHVSAEGGGGRFDLSANLPDWTLTGKANVQLDGWQDIPPIILTLQGPINRPAEQIDPSGLAGFLRNGGLGPLMMIGPSAGASQDGGAAKRQPLQHPN